VLLAPALANADLLVVQKVESGNPVRSAEITLKIKGDKMRADVSPEISTITDTATGETITLRHGPKTYLRLDARATQALLGKLEKTRKEREARGEGEETAKLEATGKRESVGGYDTRIYTAQVGELKMTYWIAQNLPSADKLLSVSAQLQKSAMVKLAKGMMPLPEDFALPGFPVKTEMATPDGRKITTTVISIKEQPLDDLDFTVPLNYYALPEPSFVPDPAPTP